MIGLFQGLVSLCDEGRRPLDALLAVGYLLRKLPKPLCLERMTNGERRGLGSEPLTWIGSGMRDNNQTVVRMFGIIRGENRKYTPYGVSVFQGDV